MGGLLMTVFRKLTAMAFVGVLLPLVAFAGPEKTEITIGLPVTTSTFLPLYMAAELGMFEEEGVKVNIVAFKGGTDLVRGMIAGAVDIGVTSLAGVNVGISAEQPLKAFYGGFNMAVFDWYGVQSINAIKDSKGTRYGVTKIGSSTDFLTRYALKSVGLNPETDVQIIQGGGSPARMAAMEAGQLDVNIFAPPEKFMAADAGYKLLLKQSDLAPDYPFHVFFATDDFRASNPETIKAVLRGFVKGVRAAKSNKAEGEKVLIERVGVDPNYAGRVYDDFIDGIYEDGRLPSEAGMKSFWDVGIMSGEYTEAWPLNKFLDPTFIDTYGQWKP
jgi:NitT/TauT family transport system substrate-binding protein